LADALTALTYTERLEVAFFARDADEKAIVFHNSRETLMNFVKLALIAAFAFTASVSVGSIVTSSSAEAQAAAKPAKPAPGKCGVGNFFDKKTKKCAAK
jgi:hypothetical protein